MTTTTALVGPAVGAILLVVTHIFLLPAIVYTAIRGYAVDITVLLMLLTASTLYHSCMAGYFCCDVSLADHRLADHSMVYIALTWLYLTLCPNIRWDVRFSVLLGIIFIIIVFNKRLFQSFVFMAMLLSFFVIYGILAIFWARLPLRRFDILAALLVAGLLVSGFVLHLVGGSPDNHNYWWAHSLWCVCDWQAGGRASAPLTLAAGTCSR